MDDTKSETDQPNPEVQLTFTPQINDMKQYSVLYTHQLMKKAKTWQDGTLQFPDAAGFRGLLFDDNNSRIDVIHVKPEQIQIGAELKSDRHLIQIEAELAPELRTRAINDDRLVENRSVRSLRSAGPVISTELTSRSGLGPVIRGRTGVVRSGLSKKRKGFNAPRLFKRANLANVTELCPPPSPDKPSQRGAAIASYALPQIHSDSERKKLQKEAAALSKVAFFNALSCLEAKATNFTVNNRLDQCAEEAEKNEEKFEMNIGLINEESKLDRLLGHAKPIAHSFTTNKYSQSDHELPQSLSTTNLETTNVNVTTLMDESFEISEVPFWLLDSDSAVIDVGEDEKSSDEKGELSNDAVSNCGQLLLLSRNSSSEEKRAELVDKIVVPDAKTELSVVDQSVVCQGRLSSSMKVDASFSAPVDAESLTELCNQGADEAPLSEQQTLVDSLCTTDRLPPTSAESSSNSTQLNSTSDVSTSLHSPNSTEIFGRENDCKKFYTGHEKDVSVEPLLENEVEKEREEIIMNVEESVGEAGKNVHHDVEEELANEVPNDPELMREDLVQVEEAQLEKLENEPREVENQFANSGSAANGEIQTESANGHEEEFSEISEEPSNTVPDLNMKNAVESVIEFSGTATRRSDSSIMNDETTAEVETSVPTSCMKNMAASPAEIAEATPKLTKSDHVEKKCSKITNRMCWTESPPMDMDSDDTMSNHSTTSKSLDVKNISDGYERIRQDPLEMRSEFPTFDLSFSSLCDDDSYSSPVLNDGHGTENVNDSDGLDCEEKSVDLVEVLTNDSNRNVTIDGGVMQKVKKPWQSNLCLSREQIIDIKSIGNSRYGDFQRSIGRSVSSFRANDAVRKDMNDEIPVPIEVRTSCVEYETMDLDRGSQRFGVKLDYADGQRGRDVSSLRDFIKLGEVTQYGTKAGRAASTRPSDKYPNVERVFSVLAPPHDEPENQSLNFADSSQSVTERDWTDGCKISGTQCSNVARRKPVKLQRKLTMMTSPECGRRVPVNDYPPQPSSAEFEHYPRRVPANRHSPADCRPIMYQGRNDDGIMQHLPPVAVECSDVTHHPCTFTEVYDDAVDYGPIESQVYSRCQNKPMRNRGRYNIHDQLVDDHDVSAGTSPTTDYRESLELEDVKKGISEVFAKVEAEENCDVMQSRPIGRHYNDVMPISAPARLPLSLDISTIDGEAPCRKPLYRQPIRTQDYYNVMPEESSSAPIKESDQVLDLEMYLGPDYDNSQDVLGDCSQNFHSDLQPELQSIHLKNETQNSIHDLPRHLTKNDILNESLCLNGELNEPSRWNMFVESEPEEIPTPIHYRSRFQAPRLLIRDENRRLRPYGVPGPSDSLPAPNLSRANLKPPNMSVCAPIAGSTGRSGSCAPMTGIMGRKGSGAPMTGDTGRSGPGDPWGLCGSRTDMKALSGDLYFPSENELDVVNDVRRKTVIPVEFEDVQTYKRTLVGAIKEYLNISLHQLAKIYHSGLGKVDVEEYMRAGGSRCGGKKQAAQSNAAPLCEHGTAAKIVLVRKEGPNKGRFFYACTASRAQQCKYFKWADFCENDAIGTGIRLKKIALSEHQAISSYFTKLGIPFYCECSIVRKTCDARIDDLLSSDKYRRAAQLQNNTKKRIYLRLSRREKSDKYAKNDLWIISQSLHFDRGETFLAKSVFYGPNTNNEVEIEPLSRYSPSNWPNKVLCHAIHACNASSELTNITNIQDFIQPLAPPLIPHLINKMGGAAVKLGGANRSKGFQTPMLIGRSEEACLSEQFVKSRADHFVKEYRLNEDQALALGKIGLMLTGSSGKSICLVHGVFGAGKSYLLAVVVLYLVELFQALNTRSASGDERWKLLVSSTTNVAVDRILLWLLELGLSDFVRVGSIKKIAKPVLPYSVHAFGSESQELRELQEMDKSELSAQERSFIRKSIEHHKLGFNRKKLSSSLVVGVTCAACPFPCMDKMKFPVVLLDECSQITEPSALLPIARFMAKRLVLVGDPQVSSVPREPDLVDFTSNETSNRTELKYEVLKKYKTPFRVQQIYWHELTEPGSFVRFSYGNTEQNWTFRQQLGPTLQGSESEHDNGLEQTLFDRLLRMTLYTYVRPSPQEHESILLRTQYRCHPRISGMANKLFYRSRLLDGVQASDRPSLLPGLSPVVFLDVPRGYEACSGHDGSYYNNAEVSICVRLIEVLMSQSGLEPDSVGVITLYRNQAAKLGQALRESGLCVGDRDLRAIQVSTVDAFQGAEKDVVILSCVRTEHVGFIDSDKRTNVALTRARHHLLIVGNQKNLIRNELWSQIIRYCQDAPNGAHNTEAFLKQYANK